MWLWRKLFIMREIICCGGSNTSHREAKKDIFYDGCGGYNKWFEFNGYPEAIRHLYGNTIYNLGVASNSIDAAVLSIISLATKLLKEKKEISIIYNCNDFYRPSFYLSKSFLNKNGIFKKIPVNYLNNYLFTDDYTGFYLFGGIQNINKNEFGNDILLNMAKTYSENIFNFEASEIKALTHLLLLQNFCKANNIPYKIFFDFNFFSEKLNTGFDLNRKNEETYFNSFFIERKLYEKTNLDVINKDPYVKDLFDMLDLDNFWFYEDKNYKWGGIHEWIYKNNEYKINDTEYIALYVESLVQCSNWKSEKNNDNPFYINVDFTKELMKKNQFFETAHPTYYYWEKFVKEVMISWNLF